MPDLEFEFAQCLDVLDQRHFARFAELGIPTRVTFGLRSLYGAGRIIPNPSGLFDFHEDGDWALVIAEGSPAEPGVPGWRRLDDLVAFVPGNPGQWWLRRGVVDLLGASNLDQYWRLEPTPLHATPLGFLRGGARGLCILDWTFDPLHELAGGPALVADSPALCSRLQRRTTEAALECLNITVAEKNLEARHAA